MKILTTSQPIFILYLLIGWNIVGLGQPTTSTKTTIPSSNIHQPITLVPKVAIQEIVCPLEGNHKPAWRLNLPYSEIGQTREHWIAYLNNQGYSTYYHQAATDSYYKTVRLGVETEEEGYMMYTRFQHLEEGVVMKVFVRYKGDFISRQTHPKVYLVVVDLLHNFAFQELAKSFQKKVKDIEEISLIKPTESTNKATKPANNPTTDYNRSTSTTKTITTGSEDIFILDNYDSKPTEPATITASTTSTVATYQPKSSSAKIITTAPPKVTAKYMRVEERGMLAEINLLRSNPSEYIPYVQEYVTAIKNSGFPANYILEEEKTAQELIQELKKMSPLSIVQPHRQLYKACENHAKDILKRGRGGHMSSDGSSPLDRVNKVAPELYGGFENLVGGGDDVRQSVIMLLVDAGIPNRGHRKNLLDPRWKYAACYKVGKVGRVNNYWIQNFAKDK